MHRIIALLLLIFGLSQYILGQEYNYRLFNLNPSKGLSSLTVQSIIEAEDGAIWISTKLGVDRYNGQRFRNYTMPQVGTTSQSNFKTLRLLLDPQNDLYAYDNKGYLFKYIEAADAFTLLFDLNELFGQEVILNCVLTDTQDGFWLALREGLCHLSAEGTVQWIEKNISIAHIDQIGELILAGSDKGIYTYKTDGSQQEQLCTISDLQSSFYDTQAGKIWFGTFHSGVKVYDIRRGSLCDWPNLNQVPNTPVRVIRPLDAQTLLIGNDGDGVFIASRDGSQVRPLFDNNDQDNSLQGKGIYDICADSQGNLWMGSYTGGVDVGIATDHLYETVQHISHNEHSLICNDVNDILQTPDNYLWYATEEGLSICNQQTNQWHHTLKGMVVLTLVHTQSGEVLAGTYGNGVYKVAPNGNATQLYTAQNGALKSNFVFRMYEDADGSLWVGCLDAPMAHISQGKSEFYPISVVQCITQMPCGDIAVGTAYSWYRVSRKGNQTEQYFSHTDFPTQDCNYSIESMLFTSDDEVWLGSDGGGVYQFKLSTREVIRNLTTDDGLPSDFISALAFDRQGNVLVSTDRGLAIISRTDYAINNISYAQELATTYNHMSVEQLNDGRVCFGSASGAIFVNPEQLRSLPYEAKLRITGVNIIGEGNADDTEWKQQIYEMLRDNIVVLSHSQNTFDIHFESICFAYQHDILYQYQLDGYDKGWSSLSNLQQAHYANLPAGRYTLHIRNVSQNNGRTLDTCTLTLIVSQPWWNTWMAWICYLLCAAILLFFLFRLLNEKQKRIEFDRKINFFLHTAHDIRTPLSLIVAPLNQIENDATLSQESRQYLQMARNGCNELQQMVTRLMDIQKTDSVLSQPTLQHLQLAAILDMHVQKFTSLATQKNIDLQLDPVDDQLTLSADQAMTDSILENLISNALKYTPEGGTVKIGVEATDQHIRILVKDTGIGIPHAEQKHIFQNFYRARNAVQSRQNGTGLGLMFSRRLAELQQGSLTFVSEEGRGTTFTLSLLRGKAPVIDIPSEEDTDISRDTLLFVDDSEQLRQYMQLAFGNTYHVVTVESAELALSYLQNQSCDVLISDVMMPGMHGDQLCRQLKDNVETSWLPVILLSANIDRDTVLGGIDAGADDYVAKPFDADLLRHRIDRLLANRRRMSRYYMGRSIQLAKGEAMEKEEDQTESTPTLSLDTNKADEAFVEKATCLVLDNLSDVDFGIDELCREMAMSRTLFYGRIKTLTSQTPQEFIRMIRLERAATLIREGKSILEVSVETGFVNVKYFSTLFKKHFGVSPSKFE